MDGIFELKDMLCEELEEYGKKDKLDVGGLDIVDKLAHTIKNLDKIIESYEDEEYSSEGYYDNGQMGDSMRKGMSYAKDRYDNRNRSSYAMARGRGRNARRDSMGRYSRADGNEMMVQELRELMEDAPNEKVKMEFKKFIQKMEQM